MSNVSLPNIYIFALQFYLLFSTIFGRAFYKFQIFGLHLSEYLILFVSFIFIFKYFSHKKKIYFPSELFLFILLWLIILINSLFISTAPLDIILRQGFQGVNLILFIFLVNFMNDINISENAKRLFAYSSISLVLAELLFTNFANLDSLYVYLVISFLLAGKRFGGLFLISLLLLPIILDHAATLLASMVFILFFLYFNYKKILFLSAFFSVPVLLILFPLLPEFYESIFDYNATWRFLYWSDVIQIVFSDISALTGFGYGIQYINPDLENFDRLIQQISWFSNSYEQSFLVPPHNSLLNIIYHLGIFGFILFCIFFVRVFRLVLFSKNKNSLIVLLSISPLIVTHNFLELPQLSIGFISVLGFIASSAIKKINENPAST